MYSEIESLTKGYLSKQNKISGIGAEEILHQVLKKNTFFGRQNLSAGDSKESIKKTIDSLQSKGVDVGFLNESRYDPKIDPRKIGHTIEQMAKLGLIKDENETKLVIKSIQSHFEPFSVAKPAQPAAPRRPSILSRILGFGGRPKTDYNSMKGAQMTDANLKKYTTASELQKHSGINRNFPPPPLVH